MQTRYVKGMVSNKSTTASGATHKFRVPKAFFISDQPATSTEGFSQPTQIQKFTKTHRTQVLSLQLQFYSNEYKSGSVKGRDE